MQDEGEEGEGGRRGECGVGESLRAGERGTGRKGGLAGGLARRGIWGVRLRDARGKVGVGWGGAGAVRHAGQAPPPTRSASMGSGNQRAGLAAGEMDARGSRATRGASPAANTERVDGRWRSCGRHI